MMAVAGHAGADWSAGIVAVCIPARNERLLLPGLLDSLAAQQAAGLDRLVACFLFDGCDDGSEAFVRDAAPRLPFEVAIRGIPGGAAPNAGRARHAALALGQWAIGARADAALLTTDADTMPAPDWIARTCRSLRGSDVVAGRILRDGAGRDPAQDRIEAYLDRLYGVRRAIDPLLWEDRPAHHHTGGASLAFRADAYAALGGFAHRPAGEDAAIVDAAHVAGLRVRRDRQVVVRTSSRREGRAPGGLAQHLQRLDGDGGAGAVRVAHPLDSVWQYRGHSAARAGFAGLPCGDTARALAERLALDPGHVGRVAAASPNAEAFATRLVPAAPGGGRLVPLTEAEHVLDRLERDMDQRAA